MNSDFAPFIFSEHEGNFSLMLTEFDSFAEVFEEAGYDAGGYAWHGVADALIRLHAPYLAKKIQFDPEASMFVAYGKDRTALKELARLLLRTMRDEVLLKTALENADPELMD